MIMGRMMRAFTLIEMVVVTVVVGILAAIVVPKFATAREDTVITATAEDLHRIAQALSLYQAVNGAFPINATRSQDAIVLESYFKNDSPFQIHTPIGGVYDFDGPPAYSPVSISIVHELGNHYDIDKAVQVDAYMDDGNLRTGRVMISNDRIRFRFDGN
jgi:prepilin-type N-terminal cleavage/methylation domain-containing protein